MTSIKPLDKTLMTTVVMTTTAILFLSRTPLMIMLITIACYLISHSATYIKKQAIYKQTQYYSLYKTPFNQLIKNSEHVRQYIIYQTLLSHIAKDGELLIQNIHESQENTILLMHTRGIYIIKIISPQASFSRTKKKKHVTVVPIKNEKALTDFIQSIRNHPLVLQPKNLHALYDKIISHKNIRYY